MELLHNPSKGYDFFRFNTFMTRLWTAAIGPITKKPSTKVSPYGRYSSKHWLKALLTNNGTALFATKNVRVKKLSVSSFARIILCSRKKFPAYRTFLVGFRRPVLSVHRLMLSYKNKLKIFNRIVRPVSVLVMHLLALAKFSAKVLFHNHSMLQHLLIADAKKPVSKSFVDEAAAILLNLRHCVSVSLFRPVMPSTQSVGVMLLSAAPNRTNTHVAMLSKSLRNSIFFTTL